MRIPQLPQWVLTGTRPAVYDTESVTALSMVAKLYGAIQDFIDDYNKFAEEVNTEIKNFENKVTTDFILFRGRMESLYQDFIDTVNRKIEEQDQVIADAVAFMKDNISESVTALVEQMKESGEIDEAIANAFENLGVRVTSLEGTMIEVTGDIVTIKSDINSLTLRVVDLESQVETNTNNIATNTNDILLNKNGLESVRNDLNTYETSNDNRVSSIENEIVALNSLYVVVDNTAEMTDPTKIYINTSNSKWYYYNGSEFVIGGSIDIDPSDVNNLKYENLDNSLRRMLVQARQCDLRFKGENIRNIITTDSYFYNGRLTNNTNLTVVVRYKMYNYRLEEITVSNPTITLAPNTYFDLQEDRLYSIEIYKSNLEDFSIPELTSLMAQFIYTPKAETIDPTNINYNMLSDSLKILVNQLRSVTFEREGTDKIKIAEELYYGSIKNDTGRNIKMFFKSTGSETYTEEILINTATFTFIENPEWSFDVYFMKSDESTITDQEYTEMTEGIKYLDGSEHFELTDNCIAWNNLNADVRGRIESGNYSFTLERVLSSNDTLHLLNPDPISIGQLVIDAFFPACKVVNNFGSSFTLLVAQKTLEGQNVRDFNQTLNDGDSITLDGGYYYEFNLFRFSGFTDQDMTNLLTGLKLYSLSSTEVLEERITALENEVGDIATALDTINGEVI